MKSDFLKTCNNPPIPLEEFQEIFCNRCMQPECSRSQYGKSSFEQRVQTWHERLFSNPVKMDPTDKRYAEISEKGFRSVHLPVVKSSSGWGSPEEAPKKPMIIVPEQLEPSVPKVSEPSPLIKTPGSNTLTRDVLFLNTPNKVTKKSAEVPTKDPWATNEDSTPTGSEKVVKTGSVIKFGK